MCLPFVVLGIGTTRQTFNQRALPFYQIKWCSGLSLLCH